MAAAGLVAALNETESQIGNAAEIGMVYNPGLTCDPTGGMMQVPCIERNAVGAAKSINTEQLAPREHAPHEEGSHKISLDQVVVTMREIGRDMSTIY